ncbi:MAG: hypothetical protein N2510_01895 [Ignavibacteria bacterium]|nr:hypothetical protein [Ignavibacteria bacterium]
MSFQGMKLMLEKLSSYNLWANRKFTEFLREAGSTLLDIEIPSSFGSVRKTIFHIWDAEYIWYERLRGNSPLGWPSEKFRGSDEEFFDLFVKQSEDLRNLVIAYDDKMLIDDFSYSNLRGTVFSNSVYDTLIHVFNHSAYHRGQIVTMLRNTGFSNLDSTDYITYIRELQSE